MRSEKMTLEEFVRRADPIPGEVSPDHPMFLLWAVCMSDAATAHDLAKKAVQSGDDRAAYRNALHAIGCYAAARAAVEIREKGPATVHATNAYLAAIDAGQTEHPHLFRRYGSLNRKIETVPVGERWNEWPVGTEKSSYAPTYLELSEIVAESVDLIATMRPKKPGDAERIAFRLKRNKRFLEGSRRMIEAKWKLHEKYDRSPVGPERERDIFELIASYRHLFYFVKDVEYDDERNTTRYKTEVFLGDILPLFDGHGMDDEAIRNYSDKILRRMLDLGMLTLAEQDDDGKTPLSINEPENW